MGLAEKILKVMNDNNITPYRLSKDTGIPYTTLSKILNGTTKSPQVSSLQIIADYLQKPLDFFTEGDQTDNGQGTVPEWATNKDKRDFKKMLEEDTGLMFDGVPIEGEDRERVMQVLEALFWDAKKTSKEKFTNKRYKKQTDNNE
ncbi:helix-turn-helix domain-containing protein [Paenibacillus sp. FSL R5-0810]|uniref:helix-turn-helix domain-containing protein n=1 Tax=Paenibacillus sp. FSL R5-0810 TaxID=2921659 RepID=UPI0030F64CFC